MSFPSNSTQCLSVVITNLQNYSANIKQQAAAAVTFMQGNSVTTPWVFSVLDQLAAIVTTFSGYKNIAGLNAYANANIPGYAGTLTADITSVVSAAQACINWVVANSTGVVWYTLNADGSRATASFTSAQTAGLQSALTALVATIS